MKVTKVKRLLICFILLIGIVGILPINVFAKTVTLDEVVEKFKQSDLIEQYENAGSTISATNDSKSITVLLETEVEKTNVIFNLEGSILTTVIEVNTKEALFKSIVAMYIADSIGQLHGYSKGDLFATINSEEISNYTLEKEGIETQRLSNGNTEIRMDINKKVPLINQDEKYFEISDLEEGKEYLNEGGSFQKSKGDLVLWKGGYNDEITVVIGEKDELTQNTYKSILSVLDVMFDSKEVVSYFESNYTNIEEGNKEFKWGKTEINPTKTEMEKVVLPENYKFIRLTINKEEIIKASKDSNNEPVKNNTINNQPTTLPTKTQSTANIGTMPNAGFEINALNILKVVLGLSISALIVYGIYNKRYNSK